MAEPPETLVFYENNGVRISPAGFGLSLLNSLLFLADMIALRGPDNEDQDSDRSFWWITTHQAAVYHGAGQKREPMRSDSSKCGVEISEMSHLVNFPSLRPL